ncbi:outer membrane protein [Candidatus Jidaibacter acanthamoebae]|nr:outer membrane beta-barrel protein [Candidatus Jidaibacter acanthamoeba]
MKKKIVNLATFAAIVSAPLLANAELNAPYLKLDLGMSMPTKLKGEDYGNKKPDNSAHYGIGFGYKIHENMRADFTLSRMHNFKFSETLSQGARSAAVKQNLHSNVGMLNVYGDFGNYSGIAPYVTAGIGFSHNKTKDFNVTNANQYYKGAEKVNFAWNLGLGVSYKMDENVCLDLGSINIMI